MDYDWGSAAPAQYPYMAAFAGNASLLDGSRDSSIMPNQNLDSVMDTSNGYLDDTHYPYAYEQIVLNPDSGGLGTLAQATHDSPQTQFSFNPPHEIHSGGDAEGDQTRRGSSEEKDSLTPAKSRRKAQNRAAQRAFRERKERHVRDLEAKLNLLTTTTSSLQSDNERLKLMLQRAQTENEILRANASSAASLSPSHLSDGTDDGTAVAHPSDRGSGSYPLFDSMRLSNGLLSTAPKPCKSLRNSLANGESRLLSASATWDLLQSHPLYLAGAVDIGEICDRLKKLAQCDGMGPMFQEDHVRRIIEEVGRSGHDELI